MDWIELSRVPPLDKDETIRPATWCERGCHSANAGHVRIRWENFTALDDRSGSSTAKRVVRYKAGAVFLDGFEERCRALIRWLAEPTHPTFHYSMIQLLCRLVTVQGTKQPLISRMTGPLTPNWVDFCPSSTIVHSKDNGFEVESFLTSLSVGFLH